MSDSADPSAEQLRSEGRLSEAAAAFRRRGDLQRAETLYAELWDFAAAAEVARERGDRPAELGHRLAANDLPGAARVGEELEHGSEAELRRAAEIYERHRRWLEAAGARERLGELERARELYRKGQALLDVARLERADGRLREAGVAYEQLLHREAEGPEAARAHLELGQLLFALDRVEEAVRHLRAAANATGPTRPPALADLAYALDRLGYEYACEAVLDELRALAPSTPRRDAFVATHRPQAAGGPTRIGGRYEVERLLGAGASGRVFAARDVITGRSVALKVLTPAHGARAVEARARFFAELTALRTLHDPNVVEIFDADVAQGLIVMELLPGGTLLDRLPPPSSPVGLPPAAVRRLLLDVLDALAAVHARGVVHRDLKPANLFYTATGQVRVGDFGAAHLFMEEATQTAGFVGTLAYMAPEQMSGGAIGAAADLYSLGAIAFHALTGRLPFPGPDFVAQHLGDPPPRPSAFVDGLDPAWDELVLTLLQKLPDARPGSIDDLRRRVERIRTADRDRDAKTATAFVAAEPQRARYSAQSPLGPGAGGPIALGSDARLGRPVVIETLSAEYLATAAGQKHLDWLRALARLGGPRLQRLFALVPRADGATEAIFEALGGGATAHENAGARLRATLASLHEAGVAHGAIERSVVHEPHGPALVVAGRSPREGATVAEDLAALAAL